MYFLIEARYALTRYVEAASLVATNSKSVKKFLQGKVIANYKLPVITIVNGGSKFKGKLA